MGEVYRARDTVLGRDVAVKFLNPSLHADPDRLARFEREARTLASLHHPNIGVIYGLVGEGATRGLVLELLDGETLAERLARGPLPMRDALRIGAQVASALSAAHCKGIIHRDLKPANIMLSGDCLVKVLDFGLAKATDDPRAATVTMAPGITQNGTVMGTPRYMSPEQARGLTVDARTDLWALGCILYEALTGKPAFVGDSPFDVLAAVVNAAPEVSLLPADTPTNVATLIDRSLDRDPDKRPATAGAVFAELEHALQRAPTPPPVAPRHRMSTVWTVLAVSAVVVWILWAGRGAGSRTATGIRSIAVRPLENISPDGSQEYFAEGMTDALTTQLAKTSGLRVVSRTSAARLADKEAAEIARTLKVDAIVEGSVLFANERVRVTARLIDPSTDTSVWADSYERELGDVLLLQADVARAIAEQIHVAASPISTLQDARASRVNPQAYREYLQGRHLWNQRTAESLQQAVAHFERAVELQPDYAPAHSGIAESLLLLSAQTIGAVPPGETLPHARAAAMRAVQIDPTLAAAHAALGRERHQMWDWKAADSESSRAVQLEPNNADWHFWRASVLASLSRHDEAIAEAQKGTDLDPMSPIVGSGLSWMYHLSRRFDDALQEARRVLAFEPTFPIAHARVGEALVALGRPAEALDPFRRAHDTSGGSPDMLAFLGHAQARAGRRSEARTTLDTLLRLRQSRYVSEYDVALVCAGLGDKPHAIEWLARGYDEHAWGLSYINVDPAIDVLRDDPPFKDLVRRIGLDPTTALRE